jgi:hypothetical protein
MMAERLQEWQRDMLKAVDDKLMRDIVGDFRSYDPSPGKAGPASTVVPVGSAKAIDGGDGAKHRGSGWTEPPSIDNWRAPGLEHMDRLMDQQDRIDRAARARELAKAAHIDKQLKDHLAKK